MHRLTAEQRLYCKCAVFAPRINPQSVHSTRQFWDFWVFVPNGSCVFSPVFLWSTVQLEPWLKIYVPPGEKISYYLWCYLYLFVITFVLWVVQLNGQQSTNWYFGWRFDSFFHNTRLLPTLGIFISGYFMVTFMYARLISIYSVVYLPSSSLAWLLFIWNELQHSMNLLFAVSNGVCYQSVS